MKKQHLLVITSYPPKGATHEKRVVGGAVYTKLTLSTINKYSQQKKNDLSIKVLAEQLKNPSSNNYNEEGIAVERIWKRNSLLTFPKLITYILKNFKNTDTILIEFEFAMFGKIIHLLPLPIFLLILKILRKKVYFVFHQVIEDVNEISEHIGIQKNSYKNKILTALFKAFYIFTLKLITKGIVFEEILKKRLANFGEKEKICVIPLGCEIFKNMPSQKSARSTLNIPKDDFVIMVFGFIAWYKGTDWIINQINNHQSLITNRRVRLIIAGGPNPNHLDKPYYLNYIKEIEKLSNQNIILTNFIPEDKVSLYFSASDLVVFPYRTLMSSSGPLTLALSFQKPLLVSRNFSKVFETEEITNILQKVKLKKEQFTFDLNNDFMKKLKAFIENSTLQKKNKDFAKELSKSKSWNIIGSKYYHELLKA